MNFPCLVFSKILNFSSQRDVQAIRDVFNLNFSTKTKIMCPFCIDTFDGMDQILFHLNKVPWYNLEYSAYRASQVTFERITLDESYRVRFRTLKEMEMTDYRNQIDYLMENSTKTILELNKILENLKLFDGLTELLGHLTDSHEEYSSIFESMMQSKLEIASIRRDHVDIGIVLDGYAGENRSVLTQTIVQSTMIMMQDLLPGSTGKFRLLPTSMHKILAFRNYLECFCDAAQFKVLEPNRESIEAEIFFGRANALRIICNFLLKLSY